MPTVMIAEDDLMLADMLSDILDIGGYDVCGIARTVDEAVESAIAATPTLRCWISGWPTEVSARTSPAAWKTRAHGHSPCLR